VRLYGHAGGYVNVDVKCTDECSQWEVHDRVPVFASGHFDTGPNVYATIVGLRAGPVGAFGANVVIAGIALLQAEQHFLTLLHDKAGSTIAAIVAQGPTALCLVSQR
jgi:hypothetical protein